MSKVTSKYQISIPKALADRVGIKVGDALDWEEIDGGLRLRPAAQATRVLSVDERLTLFDQATARQRKRERNDSRAASKSRGWKREELYSR